MWNTKRTKSMRYKSRCDAILYSECKIHRIRIVLEFIFVEMERRMVWVGKLIWKVCDPSSCSHGRALSLWQYSIIWLNFLCIRMLCIEGKANPSMPNASLNNIIRKIQANIIILLLQFGGRFVIFFRWLSPSSDIEIIFMILRGDS